MRGAVTLVLALFVLGFVSPSTAADKRTDEERTRVPARTDITQVQLEERSVLTSNGTSAFLAARETAGPDTFALYGGPDHPTEGKFQLANGVTADWGGGNGLPGGYGGGPDAWTPVDLTDVPVFWHRSQFNAQTLGTTQPSPNHAMWSGVEAGDPIAEDWATAPGYGNSWRDGLIYESPQVADPSASQTVDLDFYFHYDTEPGYDYFQVQYDSAGTWTDVMALSGYAAETWGEFHAPGSRFSDEQTQAIYFGGHDYGGDQRDQIRIRMLVTSDGAWSNEDGLWPSIAGAAQVDEITLTTEHGTFTENFESAGPYLFKPDKMPFAGDFADVYPRITDLDPCMDNQTPVVGFVDYNQIVRNGPGHTGLTTGGGSNSPGISYGIPGDYVVNYRGGLSEHERNLTNEVWSPEIAWDMPGAGDDAPEFVGAWIRWTAWTHLPLVNGMFLLWHVRSAEEGGSWDQWRDRNFVYYSAGLARWENRREEVTDLLVANPERVQMALAVWDYASIFGFAGTASTPAPCFDNAAFYKYRVQGPALATRNVDLAQDGFPVSGTLDVSTQAGRDALDIPFDMARDVNSGDLIIGAGDSVIVDVTSNIHTAEVADIRMVWALATNPVFEDAIRSVPSRMKDENVESGPAGSIWTGEVVADTSTTSAGGVVTNRFFADLPDVDFMYPGDVLHYYFQATDSEGRVSTLPHDIEGFGDFASTTVFSRTFTVRGLPSIQDTSGSQPSILVINDYGRRGNEEEFVIGLGSLGYAEGADYDTYTVQGATSAVSNGIGSAYAHGATPAQMTGYRDILYLSGTVASALLCDGSNRGNNDKGDDVGLMEAWHALPGPRNVAYFGDNVAACMSTNSGASLVYLENMLGVRQMSSCGGYYSTCGGVRDVIGGQTAPVVVPSETFASTFETTFIAYGGCPQLNAFDQIQPAPGAQVGHYFLDPSGVPVTDPEAGVASIIRDTGNGWAVTFPYSSFFVQNLTARSTGLSARASLFGELMEFFGSAPGTSPAVSSPKAGRAALSVAPNPFNPVTTVKFTAVPGSRGTVKVFNLRGELVRILHAGEFQTQEFRWDGIDEFGAAVSSGVYLIQATDGSVTDTQKVALVK